MCRGRCPWGLAAAHTCTEIRHIETLALRAPHQLRVSIEHESCTAIATPRRPGAAVLRIPAVLSVRRDLRRRRRAALAADVPRRPVGLDRVGRARLARARDALRL